MDDFRHHSLHAKHSNFGDGDSKIGDQSLFLCLRVSSYIFARGLLASSKRKQIKYESCPNVNCAPQYNQHVDGLVAFAPRVPHLPRLSRLPSLPSLPYPPSTCPWPSPDGVTWASAREECTVYLRIGSSGALAGALHTRRYTGHQRVPLAGRLVDTGGGQRRCRRPLFV